MASGVSSQNPDGSWSESLITGTGFPRVFYLRYDMYRNNWPLMALARYAKEVSASPIRVMADSPDRMIEDRSVRQ
jgi:squalene cyclase